VGLGDSPTDTGTPTKRFGADIGPQEDKVWTTTNADGVCGPRANEVLRPSHSRDRGSDQNEAQDIVSP